MNGKEDVFGNNINFPDEILSSMTIKGLLGKWTNLIYSDIRGALYKYHMRKNNIDAGDINFVKNLFETTKEKIMYLTPVLEDMVNRNITGIADIFVAVYGIASAEVYAIRCFLKYCEDIGSWDADYMWDDCRGNSRLLEILV